MTTGDVVYNIQPEIFHSLKVPSREPGFDLGSTAGESNMLTTRLHMLPTKRVPKIFICMSVYAGA